MYPNTIFPSTGLGIVQDYCFQNCNAFDVDVEPGLVSIDGDYLPIKEIFYTPEIVYPVQNAPFQTFNDVAISTATAAAVSNNFDATGNPMETVFIQPGVVTPTSNNSIKTLLPTVPGTATETPFIDANSQTPVATPNYTLPLVIGGLVGLWFLFARKKNKVTN